MNNITYRQENGHFLPEIQVNPRHSLDRWGRARKKFLQEQHQIIFGTMLMKDTLNDHLVEVQSQAARHKEILMEQLAIKTPPPDKMKHPLEWVTHMQMLDNQANEIVQKEIIEDL